MWMLSPSTFCRAFSSVMSLTATVLIDVLRIAVHHALERMLACRAQLPDSPDRYLSLPTLPIEGDPFDYQSDNLLVVSPLVSSIRLR
jgi:hypothetical protein